MDERDYHAPMFERFVHWLIFLAIVLGVLGGIVQLIRYGAIVESGGVGPAGFVTPTPTVAQGGPAPRERG